MECHVAVMSILPYGDRTIPIYMPRMNYGGCSLSDLGAKSDFNVRQTYVGVDPPNALRKKFQARGNRDPRFFL